MTPLPALLWSTCDVVRRAAHPTKTCRLLYCTSRPEDLLQSRLLEWVRRRRRDAPHRSTHTAAFFPPDMPAGPVAIIPLSEIDCHLRTGSRPRRDRLDEASQGSTTSRTGTAGGRSLPLNAPSPVKREADVPAASTRVFRPAGRRQLWCASPSPPYCCWRSSWWAPPRQRAACRRGEAGRVADTTLDDGQRAAPGAACHPSCSCNSDSWAWSKEGALPCITEAQYLGTVPKHTHD